LSRSNVAGANAHTKAELIDRLLRTLDEKGKFNGVVLVSEHSKVIYKKGFGYANYEEKKPNTVQSCFRLGSVTKQFTAMAIMLLSDRGKLSYEDDIRKYLPTLPYKGVTIRHLLVHTSGLPDYMALFDDKWDKEKLAYKEDILRLLAEHHPPVDFAPGEKWEYCNTGYSLLACIVERASGETFGEFMQKNIFTPLDMQNTVLVTGKKDQPVKNRVYGYSSSFKNIDYHYLNGIVGDGGIYSTVDDMFKWDQGLYNAGLVKKSTMAEALSPYKLNDGSTAGDYGFGWKLYRGAKQDVIEHGGSWAGFKTLIRRDLKNRNAIIILSNNNGKVEEIKLAIDKILLGGCTTEDIRQAGTLFENATVIDGSGANRQVQDVLIVDGVIAQTGNITAIAGDRRIDAEGLILAPGFIDTHSHHDRGLTPACLLKGAVS